MERKINILYSSFFISVLFFVNLLIFTLILQISGYLELDDGLDSGMKFRLYLKYGFLFSTFFTILISPYIIRLREDTENPGTLQSIVYNIRKYPDKIFFIFESKWLLPARIMFLIILASFVMLNLYYNEIILTKSMETKSITKTEIDNFISFNENGNKRLEELLMSFITEPPINVIEKTTDFTELFIDYNGYFPELLNRAANKLYQKEKDFISQGFEEYPYLVDVYEMYNNREYNNVKDTIYSINNPYCNYLYQKVQRALQMERIEPGEKMIMNIVLQLAGLIDDNTNKREIFVSEFALLTRNYYQFVIDYFISDEVYQNIFFWHNGFELHGLEEEIPVIHFGRGLVFIGTVYRDGTNLICRDTFIFDSSLMRNINYIEEMQVLSDNTILFKNFEPGLKLLFRSYESAATINFRDAGKLVIEGIVLDEVISLNHDLKNYRDLSSKELYNLVMKGSKYFYIPTFVKNEWKERLTFYETYLFGLIFFIFMSIFMDKKVGELKKWWQKAIVIPVIAGSVFLLYFTVYRILLVFNIL